MAKSVLWKYDKEFGIAYFCSSCKMFLCDVGNCRKCSQKLDWDNKDEYKGKVK
ncbi:hypothetical protein [Desnuesiella massiliensis]|uniref:hypothetical protein n=1 Tax=Desnuesiella massiliensis TaxID=1650662 RepID=UPI0018A858C5|nr:hypothetical protein [Desnuesiella massiliensis]